MVTKSEAIANFLHAKTHKDLANLYSLDMECQVNVAQDGGDRVAGEFKGKKWHGWTDGLQTWKSFRIPYKAKSDPEYDDTKATFDLAEHAEAIGMTGWDWKNRCSKWVAFDFDAIVGHSEKHTKKLSHEELENVKKAAWELPWVAIRRSTSGKGLHLYVYLQDVSTQNHTEHSALARAILGKMSALTGFNFDSRVDICGGNMWVWARKMEGTDGLKLIKDARPMHLEEVPKNWKDHVKVVNGSRRRNLMQDIPKSAFEELAGQRPQIPLDDEHKRLIDYLADNKAVWWWDQDHHMLVTHTYWLKQAYIDLDLRGIYDTISEGKEKNHDHNCFAFPLRRGAWVVRRYSQGCQEHDSWNQDGAGWTRIYLNRDPDLATSARAHGGIENTKGGFVFREAGQAVKAANSLGVFPEIHAGLEGREATLKQHKDGRLIFEIERKNSDTNDMAPNFLATGKKPWTRIFEAKTSDPVEPEVGNFDDIVRHLISTDEEDSGWVLKSDGNWRHEPLSHIRVALTSLGLSSSDISGVLGSSVFKAWKLVNKPFQPEYPGNREWNRRGAQLRFAKSDTLSPKFSTWKKVLSHCGKGLDYAVSQDGWCKANGIITGSDYLKCWIASLFQAPMEPLPYLFFYGPQNSGKSIFHEAISLLLTRGYVRAEAALISQGGFNAELEGAILCAVEEIDLRANKSAYNRIKDWVTARHLLIHPKGMTPYHVPNTTKWVQCANDHKYCPIFSGDTRITMAYVDTLDPLELIPKSRLISQLEKEAPDFLAEILSIELPPSKDRLNVPVLQTSEKDALEQLSLSAFEEFIQEQCQYVSGSKIQFSTLYEQFTKWVDDDELQKWSKIRVGKELPPKFPKARIRRTGQMYVGNIAWKSSEVDPCARLVIKDGYLEGENDN